MGDSSKPSAVRNFSMWVLNAPWQRPPHERRDEPSQLAARYRNEATRLVGLAKSSLTGETKQDLLQLALHYEALAAHAAQRSRRS